MTKIFGILRTHGDSRLVPKDELPLSIVLVPGELPRRALAIAQVRPRGLERRFIIVPETQITDAMIRRARLHTWMYAVRHPEDTGFVEFVLLPDGQLEVRSVGRGIEIGTHIPTAEGTTGENPFVAELLEHAAPIAPTDYPGFGHARVVDLW